MNKVELEGVASVYKAVLDYEYPMERIVLIGSHDIYCASTEQFAKYVLGMEGQWVSWSEDNYDPKIYVMGSITEEDLLKIKIAIEDEFVNDFENEDTIEGLEGVLDYVCGVATIPNTVVLGLLFDWGINLEEDPMTGGDLVVKI